MKVYSRKLLDNNGERYEVDFDELIFEDAEGNRVSISVYRAKTNGRLEIRGLDGGLALLPSTSNTVEIETRR